MCFARCRSPDVRWPCLPLHHHVNTQTVSEFIGNLQFQVRDAQLLEITWKRKTIKLFCVCPSSIFTTLIGFPFLVGSSLLLKSVPYVLPVTQPSGMWLWLQLFLLSAVTSLSWDFSFILVTQLWVQWPCSRNGSVDLRQREEKAFWSKKVSYGPGSDPLLAVLPFKVDGPERIGSVSPLGHWGNHTQALSSETQTVPPIQVLSCNKKKRLNFPFLKDKIRKTVVMITLKRKIKTYKIYAALIS